MLTRSPKIWLVFAILLCSATTVLNLMEGRIPSVVLAVIEIAALVVLLVPRRKIGFPILCGCYALSFVTGVYGGLTGGTGGTGLALAIGASAIGSLLVPGLTWVFLRKSLPTMA